MVNTYYPETALIPQSAGIYRPVMIYQTLPSPAHQYDLCPMPPTVIVVSGYDPLLDEAKEYHDKLKVSGVASLLKCYNSTIHAFLSFGVLDITKQGRQYLADQIHLLLK